MKTGSAGHCQIQKFAWSTTSLSDAMGLILGIGIASAVGTLVGNLILFSIIGVMAQRQQKKQEKELLKLQNDFLEMRQKETERMRRYAKMEG
jgi:uncharacterized membrane-anchored protein YhcB (DUF1043 family)